MNNSTDDKEEQENFFIWVKPVNNKKCGFPKCGKIAQSRGQNKNGSVKRFAWCRSHKRGSGKKERQAFTLKQQGI